MNKLYISITVFLALLIGITSCSDYLDQVPTDITTLEKTYETRENALQNLASVYSSMPAEFEQRWTPSGRNNTAGAWVAGTDEAEYVFDFNGAHVINNGSINPETGFVYDYWARWYKGIRTATKFMENIDYCKVLLPGDKEQWVAEARAARAIYYYYLLRLYGPVPVVNDAFSEQATISDLSIERNSVEEVVDYILSELDLAIKEGLLTNIKISGVATSSDVNTSSDKGLGIKNK